MKQLLPLAILLAGCAVAIAATPEKRPTRIWNKDEDLPSTFSVAYVQEWKTQQVVVKPAETEELLANPGIGWETFQQTRKQDQNLPRGSLRQSTMPAGAGANWNHGLGKLNTGFLDKVLKETQDSGQKLAFRVMCCSTTRNSPYHPKWLKEVGGKELPADYQGQGPYPIPDMDDPVVLNAHLDFIKRLGEKYDGHPGIDHIDLGSIGWWGEWHLSGSKKCKLPTLENRMKVVDAYLAAFKKTPLLMLIGGDDCLKYACAHGTGWRADCLGDMGGFSRTWCHMLQAYPAGQGSQCKMPGRPPPWPGKHAGTCGNGSARAGRCGTSSIMPWPAMLRSSTTSRLLCHRAQMCGPKSKDSSAGLVTALS